MKVKVTNVTGVHKVLTLKDNSTLRLFSYKSVEVDKEHLTPYIMNSKEIVISDVEDKSAKVEAPVVKPTEKETKNIKSKGGANK